MQPPVTHVSYASFFIGQITTGMRIKVKTFTLGNIAQRCIWSKKIPMTIFNANKLENFTRGQQLNLPFLVVYDRNHYFGTKTETQIG